MLLLENVGASKTGKIFFEVISLNHITIPIISIIFHSYINWISLFSNYIMIEFEYVPLLLISLYPWFRNQISSILDNSILLNSMNLWSSTSRLDNCDISSLFDALIIDWMFFNINKIPLIGTWFLEDQWQYSRLKDFNSLVLHVDINKENLSICPK